MTRPTIYTLKNSEYSAFWNTRHEAFKARIATRNHLETQARIIRERGGQIKKADRHMTAATYAHLATQAAIIKSTSWAYRSYTAYPDSNCKACRTANDRLMHNCV